MTEKKRFEKAMSQLDSAFQKAKEVKEVKAPEFKAPGSRAPEVYSTGGSIEQSKF